MTTPLLLLFVPLVTLGAFGWLVLLAHVRDIT